MADGPVHLLFVDDEVRVRDGLARSLRGVHANWRLHFARDGADALASLRRQPCEVVVADMRMPGMSGVQLLQQVAGEWPDCVRLMLTGNTDLATTTAAVNEGHIFRFLQKPCPREQLVLSLELAVRHYQWQTSERNRLRSRLEHAQRLAVVGEFTAGVVHDLNNLLGVMINVADNPDLFSKEKALKLVSEAAHRSAEMTRELMGFSRRDALVAESPIELGAAVQSSAVLLRPLLAHRHKLVLTLPAEPLPVWGVAGRIKQIVTNLVINARDAMPEPGEIEVSVIGGFMAAGRRAVVEAVAAGEEVEYARLSVRDTGCGMDAATRRRIFEPFFTTKSTDHGTGLGLALVQQMVAGMQGWLEVESAVGEGTVFHVFLPQVAVENAVTMPGEGKVATA